MIYYESAYDFPEKLILHDSDELRLKNGTNFRVLKKLGQGGFASVYKVEEISSTEKFAIKVLNLTAQIPEDYDKLKKKFFAEFKVGKASINDEGKQAYISKHLVKNYFVGMILGNPYIMMELCPNGNLETGWNKFNSESQYDQLAAEILVGLKDLHDNGIIHRDIKPENILFGKNNVVKIGDFGISGFLNQRMTIPGIFGNVKDVFASILHCPNEAINLYLNYKSTKPTLDIYSFGVTMYYVLSKGKLPFHLSENNSQGQKKIRQQKKNEDYTPISKYNPLLHEKWKKCITKCLRNEPKKRYQSVDEVIASLNLKTTISSLNIEDGEWLFVVKGEQKGHKYNLLKFRNRKKIIRLGRYNPTVENDVSILETNTTYISSRHLTLEFNKGDWYLRDGQFVRHNGHSTWVQSTNHTIVNFHKFLVDNTAVRLNSGDIFRIGNVELKYISNN